MISKLSQWVATTRGKRENSLLVICVRENIVYYNLGCIYVVLVNSDLSEETAANWKQEDITTIKSDRVGNIKS